MFIPAKLLYLSIQPRESPGPHENNKTNRRIVIVILVFSPSFLVVWFFYASAATSPLATAGFADESLDTGGTASADPFTF